MLSARFNYLLKRPLFFRFRSEGLLWRGLGAKGIGTWKQKSFRRLFSTGIFNTLIINFNSGPGTSLEGFGGIKHTAIFIKNIFYCLPPHYFILFFNTKTADLLYLRQLCGFITTQGRVPYTFGFLYSKNSSYLYRFIWQVLLLAFCDKV